MVLQQLSAQELIDKISVMVLGLDDQGRISLINEKVCEVLSYSSDELIGMDWFATFLEPAERQSVREVFFQVMAGTTDHARYHENFILTRSGELRMIAWHNTILEDSEGTITGVLCTGEDISTRKQMEENLRESEHRFRRFVDHAADILFIFDSQGRFVDVNRQACRSLGYTREELLELSIFDIDPEVSLEQVKQAVRQIVGKGTPLTVQSTPRHRDGHIFSLEVRVDSFESCGEKLFIAIGRDISERKSNEEKYRQLFERTPLAYQSLDEDGCILEVNHAWIDSFGYSREEVIGRNIKDFLTPDSQQTLSQQFPILKETGSVSGVDFTLLNKNGTTTRVEVTGRVFPETDQPAKTHCILTDVGRQRQLEQELEQSRVLLESIFLSAPIGIGLVVDRKILWLNKKLTEITGYGEDELVGQSSCFLYVHEEEFLRVGQEIYNQIVTSQDHTGTVEALLRRKDGSLFEALISSTPLDPDDLVQGVVFTLMDISQQKKDQQQLQQVKEEWEKTFDAIKDIITIQDLDMRIVRANKAGREIAGDRSPFGEHCYALFFGFNEPCMGCPVAETKKDGQPHTRLMHYQGVDRQYEVSSAPVFDDQGNIQHLVQVTRDVTDRIQAENEHTRLMAAIDQTSEAIVVTDIAPSIQYVNPAFEHSTGYSFDEVRDQNPSILQSGVHDADFYKKMWNTLVRGKVWKGHIVNKRKDGALFEEDVTISPVRNREGMITNYVAVKRDITREVALERQLNQAMKMEAIGTLAGGIAHDFNNILAAVLGYAEIVDMQLAIDDPVKQDMAHIITAGNRAAELVKQILTFSRQEEEDLRPVQLQFVLQEALKLLRSSLPSTIDLQQDIDTDCGSVLADPTRIHQVLMNLCTNAKQAMGDQGGALRVSLDEIYVDSTSPNRPHPSIKQGRWLKLEVSDSGSGMEAHIKERIFDPFFTTKVKGEGTGLGLSVVHGIVKSHGGEITVSSQPGEGTIFHVYLPVIDTEQGADASVKHPSLPGGSERILFVDDELMLVNIMGRMLTNLGYTVVTLTDSKEALQWFRDHTDEIDLIVTDMTMPHLTGVELAKRILQLRPEMPIILCTGYSEYIGVDQAKAIGIREFVAKPVDKKTLAGVVRKVLDA